jgi:hypothetical protein
VQVSSLATFRRCSAGVIRSRGSRIQNGFAAGSARRRLLAQLSLAPSSLGRSPAAGGSGALRRPGHPFLQRAASTLPIGARSSCSVLAKSARVRVLPALTSRRTSPHARWASAIGSTPPL